MDLLVDLLNANKCDVESFLDLTHKTLLLFVLEEMCKKLKADQELRTRVVRDYQRSTKNERVTKRLVRELCGTELPEKDLQWLNCCVLDFLRKLSDRKPVPKTKKIALLEKQLFKCACCGKDIDINNSHYDHIIPWDYVGDEMEDNYQMLCSYCNEHKSSSSYYLLKRQIIKKNA